MTSFDMFEIDEYLHKVAEWDVKAEDADSDEAFNYIEWLDCIRRGTISTYWNEVSVHLVPGSEVGIDQPAALVVDGWVTPLASWATLQEQQA